MKKQNDAEKKKKSTTSTSENKTKKNEVKIQKVAFPDLCLADLMGNPDHFAKVQFALKLGYNEHELLTVLRQVGPDAKKDQILGELVKLAANKSSVNSSQGHTDEDTINEIMEGIILEEEDDNLKHIIIDGSNLAKVHGNKDTFSCRGIQLAVDYFLHRGHRDITVFVPQWRKETPRPDAPIANQEILFSLEKRKLLVFTPARRIGGKRIVCYDDRYILKLAVETGGIIVSNDNYRDLVTESLDFRRVVDESLLMYSFVNDRFMPPDDPLGRHGPVLDNFLCKEPHQPDHPQQMCPYQKKCTYGNKCKYYHPERGSRPQKSVSEKLVEDTKVKLQDVKERKPIETKANEKSEETEQQPLQQHTTISTDPERKRAQDERLDKYRLIIQEAERKTPSMPPTTVILPRGIPYQPNLNAQNIPYTKIPGGALALRNNDDGSHNGHRKSSEQSQTDVISHGRDMLPIATVGSQVEELHRKLDRQLSLNNSDHDYRTVTQGLYRPYMSMSTSRTSEKQYQPQQLPRPLSEHPPIARAISDRAPVHHHHIPEHAHVARMASDPYPHIRQPTDLNHTTGCHGSSSDPTLNAAQYPSLEPWLRSQSGNWVQYHHHQPSESQYQYIPPDYQHPPSRYALPQQPVHNHHGNNIQYHYEPLPPPPQHVQLQPPSQSMTHYSVPADTPIPYDDPRYQLYYHLCCIFPDESVIRSVMNANPHELNPQKICASILEQSK